MPHGVASEKLIEKGDFVTFDFGALYNGYCSDITRTVAVEELPNLKLQEIYGIVLQAQQLGVAAVKPGVTAMSIDKIVRDFIAGKGYASNFGHSTGHGVGIEIHENPGVNQTNKQILQPGMVITVEPGIYVPGLGGVRIEDDVLVTDNGGQLITTYPKQLLIIKKEA